MLLGQLLQLLLLALLQVPLGLASGPVPEELLVESLLQIILI
jgi:hypothetical protein